jgi:C-terminal processing protease CtpA/Prc
MQLRKVFNMDLCKVKKILVLTVLTLVSSASVFGNDNIKRNPNSNQLQDLINNAKQNSTITIPKGVYTEPIEIRKPLTLKGISIQDSILDVISEKAAILIDTRDKVILENITVKWQRLTADKKAKCNASIVMSNAQVKLSNCSFVAKEKGARCRSAIEVLGASNVIFDRCLTNGFEIALFFKEGSKGLLSNCVLIEPARYGVSIFPHSKVDVKDSIVVGSKHQGIVNSGFLTLENSLIKNNKNIGIRIQDSNAIVRNNVFMNNGSAIVGFKKSDVLIENNIVLKSKFSGVAASSDSCFTIQDNIIYENTTGIKVIDKEDSHINLVLRKNTFWQNNNDTENVKNIGIAIHEDPDFQDATNGDFATKSDKIKFEKQGLSNPSSIKLLWITLTNTTDYLTKSAQVNAGIITGKVLDAQGKPVVGAVVIVCDQDTGVLINKHTSRPFTENKRVLYDENALDVVYALTDSQGRFSVKSLKKGEYRVFSQSWKNTKEFKSILENNGKAIELHGTAKHIKVPSGKAEDLELRPLGNGTLHIMPNSSHLTIISTAPPRADPVLMFWSLGDEFLQNIVGGNYRMPSGETIVHGMPEGKAYVAVYNYDQEPGFGIAAANIYANTVTKVDIPVIASWTNAHHQPPERLMPLLKEVVDKQLSLSELLGGHVIDIYYLMDLGEVLEEIGPLERKISLPNSQKTSIADILAVFRYAKIQQIVKEKKRRQELNQLRKSSVAEEGSYEESFYDFYFTVGEKYPSFDLKNIDWRKVGEQFLPKAQEIKNDDQFGMLCMELVACLKDSHARVLEGKAKLPLLPLPRFDQGFACLKDDCNKPVVYYVARNSPAAKAGVKAGMTVISINGEDAESAIENTIRQISKYIGYSSNRYLRYNAYRWFVRQMVQGTIVKFEMVDTKGKIYKFELPATMDVHYTPRLPVPNPGIDESANVSWKMLESQIGYIYVRRIRDDLIELFDKAVEQLKYAKGIIIDVRGNSGGGFDRNLAHLNFTSEDEINLPEKPRFKGPLALLVDARCISAGEGWASWFVANKRARLFGETTAGASSRKIRYELKNGLFKVQLPVKFYQGYLDRPIEYHGLRPDVSLLQKAKGIVEKRDTVLEAAEKYLLLITK